MLLIAHRHLRSPKLSIASNSNAGTLHNLSPTCRYPDANVPVIQLSLHKSLDPAMHLKAGQALAPLRAEGVLIVGSGAATHNLGAMGEPLRPPVGWARDFDAWLEASMTQASPVERIRRLLAISSAPNFRKAHPREDHLIPALVVAGAATPGVPVPPPAERAEGSVDAGSGATSTSLASSTGASAAVTEAATVKVGIAQGKRAHTGWAMSSFSLTSFRFE